MSFHRNSSSELLIHLSPGDPKDQLGRLGCEFRIKEHDSLSRKWCSFCWGNSCRTRHDASEHSVRSKIDVKLSVSLWVAQASS